MPSGGTPVERTHTPRVLIALALALCLPGSLHAQGPSAPTPDSAAVAKAVRGPLMQPSAVWAPAAPALPGDTTAARPETHWARGAMIGGAVVGLGVAWFAAEMCDGDSGSEDCGAETIGGFLIGAAVGAGLGAFIGARFPKHPKPVEEAGAN